MAPIPESLCNGLKNTESYLDFLILGTIGKGNHCYTINNKNTDVFGGCCKQIIDPVHQHGLYCTQFTTVRHSTIKIKWEILRAVEHCIFSPLISILLFRTGVSVIVIRWENRKYPVVIKSLTFQFLNGGCPEQNI